MGAGPGGAPCSLTLFPRPSPGPPAQILGPLSGADCSWQLPLEGQPAVGGAGWGQATSWQPWGPGQEGRPPGRW